MPTLNYISAPDIAGKLSWSDIVDALVLGHKGAKPELGDQFLTRKADTLLSRSAWIDGLGIGVKSVTVMPDNAVRGLPSVHGAMLVFDDQTGQIRAVIDSNIVTYWKTAGDSVYGAKLLARPDSQRLLILGAGVLAESLVRAYCEIFSSLDTIHVWNRTGSRAEALCERLRSEGFPIHAVADLPAVAGQADIMCTATMAVEPILRGEWVAPGTHVDLIGAFRADMREADDLLLQKGRLFVDSRETTLNHIGELMRPIASGAINVSDVLADLYELTAGESGRRSDADITVFKNGGGAHLDLMTANVIIKAATSGG